MKNLVVYTSLCRNDYLKITGQGFTQDDGFGALLKIKLLGRTLFIFYDLNKKTDKFVESLSRRPIRSVTYNDDSIR